MKKIVLLILVFVTSFFGYAEAAKNKKKQNKSNKILCVEIHRTVCFGKCPDYRIEINRNGMLTYTAIRFNEDTGIFKKDIGKEKAMEIIDMFVKYRVDTCTEMYENRIPDLPGLNFTIMYKKGKKSIYSAHFGPDFLTEIAGVMDEVGIKKDNTWKKTGMPKLE